MQQGEIADLDSSTALITERLGSEFKQAIAESIMLATARTRDTVLQKTWSVPVPPGFSC